jgi:hypothetical protein
MQQQQKTTVKCKDELMNYLSVEYILVQIDDGLVSHLNQGRTQNCLVRSANNSCFKKCPLEGFYRGNFLF